MWRFLAGCVVVAAVCVGGVLLLSKGIPEGQPFQGVLGADNKRENRPDPNPRPAPKDGTADKASSSPEAPRAASQADHDNKKAVVYPVAGGAAAQPLVLQEGRILAIQRQDVPSERDGKLLFLATPARPGEFVPKSKLLEFEVPALAVIVTSAAAYQSVPLEERVIDVDAPKALYRAVRPSDSLAPGTTAVVRQKVRFRKLDIGDRVSEGQTLGVINPALAIDELYAKQASVEIADKEINQSVALREEYKRRALQMAGLRAKGKGYVNDDEYFAAIATEVRYREEAEAKRAGLKKAQRELSGSLTTLKMHTIKASIDGVIKSVYKQTGESVKNLEPVLQIQNPNLLRVEAQVEIQDALALRDRLETARKYRDHVTGLRQKAEQTGQPVPESAKRYTDAANALLAVEVEASRVEPPRAVLAGHLQEVTCVAVSGGPAPKVISGSEDHTVRIWERVPNSERWEEKARLDHHAVVRAVACTAAGSKRNLLLTATATGRGRLFDLGALEDAEKQVMLSARHSGAVNAVAFNADGSICATGGEDQAICLWETSEGKLLGRTKGAHKAGVTSLAFTPKGQLVSAGKDRRLIVWDLADGGEGGRTLKQTESVFDRRSGEVPVLGIDPEGTHALFDEGRELRVLSLSSRKIEGTLANPPGAGSFATLALYSPDGHTILTNSSAAGRLQLWRAPTTKARAAELRQFAWSNGTVTSGAFDPAGAFAVTGTSDARVLVWAMPSKAEAEKPIAGQLSYVEEFLDTSLKRVAVRATLENPGWIIPGGTATIVVPPQPTK